VKERTPWQKIGGVLLAACIATAAQALEVRFTPLAQDVFVFIGETGPRTVANQALNANIGLVVTPAGAVLIDSGATRNTAGQIQSAARAVTDQPIRWVINTGTQDHRWLGNGFFAENGAEIIAHRNADADMHARGGDQLATLAALLKDDAAGTVPRFPGRWIESPDTKLQLGGVTFELRHRGGGHTPGDMMVWLPQKDVLFAGDIVYVDRLLAVLPVSNTRQWLAAFDELERIRPTRIVPGHGRVTDLATARRQTRDYLAALRAHMKRAVDRGEEIGDAVRTFDGRPYLELQMAVELLPGNANRAYLEIERE
jgi:glyoxylase-like metal-dependent hydrolase (beta-lactamase superfamily II)